MTSELSNPLTEVCTKPDIMWALSKRRYLHAQNLGRRTATVAGEKYRRSKLSALKTSAQYFFLSLPTFCNHISTCTINSFYLIYSTSSNSKGVQKPSPLFLVLAQTTDPAELPHENSCELVYYSCYLSASSQVKTKTTLVTWIISQNHRITKVVKDLQDHWSPTIHLPPISPH